MPRVFLGTKDEPPIELKESNDLIAVRTRSRRIGHEGPRSGPHADQRRKWKTASWWPPIPKPASRSTGCPSAAARRSVDERKTALRSSPDVRFAGSVLVDPGHRRSR